MAKLLCPPDEEGRDEVATLEAEGKSYTYKRTVTSSPGPAGDKNAGPNDLRHRAQGNARARTIARRVLTTSDLHSPGGDEPVKKWKNHDWDAAAGKAKRYYKTRKPKAEKLEKTRAARLLTCKRCGGEGHFAKTCKTAAVQSLPSSEGTPR
jgi:hypothetical protein